MACLYYSRSTSVNSAYHSFIQEAHLWTKMPTKRKKYYKMDDTNHVIVIYRYENTGYYIEFVVWCIIDGYSPKTCRRVDSDEAKNILPDLLAKLSEMNPYNIIQPKHVKSVN